MYLTFILYCLALFPGITSSYYNVSTHLESFVCCHPHWRILRRALKLRTWIMHWQAVHIVFSAYQKDCWLKIRGQEDMRSFFPSDEVTVIYVEWVLLTKEILSLTRVIRMFQIEFIFWNHRTCDTLDSCA